MALKIKPVITVETIKKPTAKNPDAEEITAVAPPMPGIPELSGTAVMFMRGSNLTIRVTRGRMSINRRE